MSLIPLDVPAGLYRNGTDFEQSNRWRDGNLVRWFDGSLRPVGGWETRIASAFDSPPRAMLAWLDNTQDSRLAAGTYNKLYAINASGTITDITPAGLVAGQISGSINSGYGGGFFGLGFYGTVRLGNSTYSEATTWSLDNWGENLVACSVSDGKIYEWDLTGVATQVANAPVDNYGIMVTEERFLMALGAGGDPRAIQWCDREDNTLWAADETNEAGSYVLQTNGRIMCGVKVRGAFLVLTGTDAHLGTYAGPPFVYGFQRVGTACGVVSRKAAVAANGGAFWMGDNRFFYFDGNFAAEIGCDVQDYVFGDMNRSQISKVHAVHNSQHGEIWWFYPSSGSIENDRYVCFDYRENHWNFGELARTAGVDRSVFTSPIWADPDGNVYNHEVGFNYDGSSVFAETGPITLGNGDAVMKVNNLYPDEKTQGDAALTFKTRFYPNDVERDYGPYSLTNPTSVRFTGRQIRMRVDGARLADWRFGVPRIEAYPGGKR